MAFNLAEFDVLLLDIGESYPPAIRQKRRQVIASSWQKTSFIHACKASWEKFFRCLMSWVLFQKRRLEDDVR
jgi:hypothetical protein